MTDTEGRLFATMLGLLWLASLACALTRRRAAAAVLNILFAASICGLTAIPTLFRCLLDRVECAARLGGAVSGNLLQAACILALSAVAVVASLLSLRRSAWWQAVGLLAYAPIVAVIAYLAFFWHAFG